MWVLDGEERSVLERLKESLGIVLLGLCLKLSGW